MTTPQGSHPPVHCPRVLVVDNTPAVHEEFRRALCPPEGTDAALTEFHVDWALQGRDAYEMVRHGMTSGTRYTVAFVDMRMPPGWDGVETIERIWEIDPNIQMVICASDSHLTWTQIVARLGKSDQLLLLRKPFDPSEAWQMATALSQRWALERRIESQVATMTAANRALREEIQRREQVEARAVHSSLHDALTGLPNRAMLADRLDRAIQRSQREPDFKFAVLFLDLDNFKVVNDSLGHSAGDTLLKEFAARVTTCLRGVDTVAKGDAEAGRLGGDEFIIVLEGIRQRSDAVLVADRLNETLRQPFHLAGQDVRVSASMGIAYSDQAGGSADQLLQRADTAMYRAKGSGKARLAVFDQAMQESVIERLRIENDLRFAIDRGELRLVYQPIVHLETGGLRGFEALLRWTHPTMGEVPPERFIPIAEEVGAINDIGMWVLRNACTQAKRWRREAPEQPALCVNVNLSRRQLWSNHVVDDVQGVIKETGIEPSWLSLEVTESMIMADPESVRLKLEALRSMGISTQIDDFGTGHSSLSCLHRFPIDILKVDRAFVGTTIFKRDYAAVIAAIATLAHNLGAKVTAEGIETDAQLAMLLAVECDFGQGFLFSRPIECEDVINMIRARRTWGMAA